MVGRLNLRRDCRRVAIDAAVGRGKTSVRILLQGERLARPEREAQGTGDRGRAEAKAVLVGDGVRDPVIGLELHPHGGVVDDVMIELAQVDLVPDGGAGGQEIKP